MMHAGEVATDVSLVRRLISEQFPRWAELPISAVASSGTDNALYRLGTDMVVRLPRIDWAVAQVAKEQRWLPRLASHLSLSVPVPLAAGGATAYFPWPWSVYSWLEGREVDACLKNSERAAITLAGFLLSLQACDTTGGPTPGPGRTDRGLPLDGRDGPVREAITTLGQVYDSPALTQAWEDALHAPAWDRPPVWLHGDLQPSNLLERGGDIRAVLDFGCLGVGDPACDVMIAWKLFDGAARTAFRDALQVDDAAWRRGRGWALSTALIALPYYWDTNPGLVANSHLAVAAVLADLGLA